MEKEGDRTWASSISILPSKSETLALTVIAMCSGSDVNGSVQVGFIRFNCGILTHYGISLHPLPIGMHMHGLRNVDVSMSPLTRTLEPNNILEEQSKCPYPSNMPKDLNKGMKWRVIA